jgi:hypothetical protein
MQLTDQNDLSVRAGIGRQYNANLVSSERQSEEAGWSSNICNRRISSSSSARLKLAGFFNHCSCSAGVSKSSRRRLRVIIGTCSGIKRKFNLAQRSRQSLVFNAQSGLRIFPQERESIIHARLGKAPVYAKDWRVVHTRVRRDFRTPGTW